MIAEAVNEEEEVVVDEMTAETGEEAIRPIHRLEGGEEDRQAMRDREARRLQGGEEEIVSHRLEGTETAIREEETIAENRAANDEEVVDKAISHSIVT